MTACSTPEASAPLTGVSREDASELDRLVHTKTQDRIISYERRSDGSIAVNTTSEFQVFIATRVEGRWRIEEMGIVP
jgi:hypothetical protein